MTQSLFAVPRNAISTLIPLETLAGKLEILKSLEAFKEIIISKANKVSLNPAAICSASEVNKCQ